ncbi:MAG: hypothetical protein GSR73_00265 [Desulfurococcales archaeon]|nr:hypothetical protein [Desulfurococcales archaeon]
MRVAPPSGEALVVFTVILIVLVSSVVYAYSVGPGTSVSIPYILYCREPVDEGVVLFAFSGSRLSLYASFAYESPVFVEVWFGDQVFRGVVEPGLNRLVGRVIVEGDGVVEVRVRAACSSDSGVGEGLFSLVIAGRPLWKMALVYLVVAAPLALIVVALVRRLGVGCGCWPGLQAPVVVASLVLPVLASAGGHMSGAEVAGYPPLCVLDAAEAGVSGAFHDVIESLIVVFVVAGVAGLYYTRSGGAEYFDSFLAVYGFRSLLARALLVWLAVVLFLYTGFFAMTVAVGAFNLALYYGPSLEDLVIWLPLAASTAVSSLLVVFSAGMWSYASKMPLAVLVGLAVALITMQGALLDMWYVECTSSLRATVGQRGLGALALSLAGVILFIIAWRRR